MGGIVRNLVVILIILLGVILYQISTQKSFQNISQNVTPSQNFTAPRNVTQKHPQNIKSEAENVTKEKNVAAQNISRWWAGAIAFQNWDAKDIYFLFPNGTIIKLPLPAFGGFSVTHNGTIAYTELIDSEGKPTQDFSKAVGSKIVVFSLIENKVLFTVSPGRWNCCPWWTPWQDLVFVSTNATYSWQNKSLYILKKDGSLVKWTKTPTHPNWSPDGKYLAFEEPREKIVYINIVDSSGTTLFVTVGVVPAWSPDGKFLACITAPFQIGIKLIDIENKEEKMIFTGGVDMSVRSLAFSPDGKYVVFSGNNKIFRINIDGSNLKELAHLPFDAFLLQFVPP